LSSPVFVGEADEAVLTLTDASVAPNIGPETIRRTLTLK
jgi:hypothetical protein